MLYNSASVLPTGIHKGTQYYYFALEKSDNSLSPFGGSKDPGDNGLPEQTAARELWEESNGIFGSKNYIFKKLKNWQNTNSQIKRINTVIGKHICYIVPFNIANPMKAFKQAGPNQEIQAIIPMRRSDLIKSIDKKNWNFQGYKIRKCARKVLKQARTEGKI